jgi:hypothetical protein
MKIWIVGIGFLFLPKPTIMRKRLLSLVSSVSTTRVSGFLAIALTFFAVLAIWKVILMVVGQVSNQLALQDFVAHQP